MSHSLFLAEMFFSLFILFQEEAKIWNDSHEAKKVIRHVIKDLEKDGLVYLKDSRRDLYQV